MNEKKAILPENVGAGFKPALTLAPTSVDEYFPQPKSGNETRNFFLLLVIVLSAFSLCLFLLSMVEVLPEPIQERITTIRTTFSIEQREETPPPPPPPPPRPIDLSERVRVNETAQIPQETPPPQTEQRRVFGLEKVFSTGLGAGGSMSNAVVGRFGNTIEGEVDTLTATADDISSRIVPAASITQAPVFRRRVLPEITDEIRRSGVSGTVRVRVLVDIDGRVVQAIAQNDLGFGTAEAAVAACLQMEFTPAKIGEQLVAVWITIPVRFERL
ncbi:MAG: energy transducer TonB [Chitinivibrionia bacterium]|nr:energy transducer TonB [Chitinivibrionia bacterium]